MRKITHIVVHCTATLQTAKIESIQRYWREVMGWKSPGYHHIVEANGKITQLHPEHLPSYGVAGYNSTIVNVCYIGGIDDNRRPIDNRTPAQKESLLRLLRELRTRYPDALIQGHRDFQGVKKACPSFDAKTEYQNI